MIPEQLKLSILQSAFQGKLTGECVPNETADDLYQQIQSEKQRLISEKKIKKEKPLPEISADEIPFDIPDNWRWCYVGDLFLHREPVVIQSNSLKFAILSIPMVGVMQL